MCARAMGCSTKLDNIETKREAVPAVYVVTGGLSPPYNHNLNNFLTLQFKPVKLSDHVEGFTPMRQFSLVHSPPKIEMRILLMAKQGGRLHLWS